MRHEESKIRTADGLTLYQQMWRGASPKAHVAIVHGLGEHSARYQHVATRFVDAGYDVHSFDLRGHGRSEGERTYIETIEEHTSDVDRFIESARSRADGSPLFLLGHSMGGAISARYLVDGERGFAGAILSAPAVRRAGVLGRPLEAIFLWFANRWPRALKLPKIDGKRVSRHPEIVREYNTDPLVFHEGVPFGTGAALVRSARHVDRNAAQIRLPILLAHGTKDSLVNPDASKRLHGRVGSTDKTLKLFPGLFHEILNEPERDAVMDDMVAWMDARV